MAKPISIEAGWQGLKAAAIPRAAPEAQVEEMRSAFFAGAHFLLQQILKSLDPGEEPTDADLAVLAGIEVELDQFILEYKQKNLKTAGNA